MRLFLRERFGRFAQNLKLHHDRLEIVRPGYDTRALLGINDLLAATVKPALKDRTPSPLLAGALLRAVLLGEPYPAQLMNQVELRVRAGERVTRARAAIVKAWLLGGAENAKDAENTENTRNATDAEKAATYEQYKEALSVELNENTTYQPYLLGRLFAVLEGLQQAAHPGINITIRDRFFNAACATPDAVFPQLIMQAQADLREAGGGFAVSYSKQLGEIFSRFDSEYPVRLSLHDQGIFQVGYYHQTQARYAKKQEKREKRDA